MALAIPCKYGPSRTEPRWRWITWGSVSAAIVWLAASALFSWYVASFGIARGSHGLHNLDLDLNHRGSSRRQAQCGDGTPDSARRANWVDCALSEIRNF